MNKTFSSECVILNIEKKNLCPAKAYFLFYFFFPLESGLIFTFKRDVRWGDQ